MASQEQQEDRAWGQSLPAEAPAHAHLPLPVPETARLPGGAFWVRRRDVSLKQLSLGLQSSAYTTRFHRVILGVPRTRGLHKGDKK